MNHLQTDWFRVAGDGYDPVEEQPQERQPDTRQAVAPRREIPVEEIRGPALQRWIDSEMPHTD